jgi:hypothetical protein
MAIMVDPRIRGIDWTQSTSPPSLTSPRTAWRSTSSDNNHSPGTSRSAAECLRDLQAANASEGPPSAWDRRHSCPTGHCRCTGIQCRLPPRYIPDSESDSECSDNSEQPRAPPAPIFRNGQLMLQKEYQGRMQFTYVDTHLSRRSTRVVGTTGTRSTPTDIWSGLSN